MRGLIGGGIIVWTDVGVVGDSGDDKEGWEGGSVGDICGIAYPCRSYWATTKNSTTCTAIVQIFELVASTD